jgi:nicotinamidase-related amidase
MVADMHIAALCLVLGGLCLGACDNKEKEDDNPNTETPVEIVDESIHVSLRQHTTVTVEQWEPTETAIVICDMWDKHWCTYATARVTEMAGAMNDALTAARNKGVAIVHAPSDCMGYYRDYPGRKEAMKYSDAEIAGLANGEELPSEENALWPVDQSDGGCDGPGFVNDPVWTRQIATLTIDDNDLISASGEEIGAYFKETGIKNVILMGVHTNMCIVNRTFGLRAMTRMNMNAVLVRDLTDLMYNPERYPYVSHFEGLDLMIDYIEKYICPTMLSTDLTQKAPFVFAERQPDTDNN